MIKKVKVLAPAKINLGLEILGKRSDGYHEVDMIMQSINLFDEIEIEKSCDKELFILHERPIGCSKQEDIVYKCASLFFERAGKKNEGIKIKVKKNIPISAGLAGGSSDGAAILLALNYMYGEIFNLSDLMKIGGEIGADIPFCILGGSARAKGRGTALKSISSNLEYLLVAVKPDISVSTREAYALADNLKIREIKSLDSLEEAIVKSDFENFFNGLFNRFESLILNPIVNDLKLELFNLGARAALMTGSGPTVYGIFRDEFLASICYKALKAKYNEVFICSPIKSGAKVIKA